MSEDQRIFEAPHPDDPVRPMICRPLACQKVTDRYELVDVTRIAAEISMFRVVHDARWPGQTDAQAKAHRLDKERWFRNLSVMRFLAHRAAEALGYPERCRRPDCRRARGCVTDRSEHDWGFPGPWMPPCASTYGLVDRVRMHIRIHYYGEQVRPLGPAEAGGDFDGGLR
jgi:hypothetical protein